MNPDNLKIDMTDKQKLKLAVKALRVFADKTMWFSNDCGNWVFALGFSEPHPKDYAQSVLDKLEERK